ncbi:MAG TPA: helix-turn-helix domain-containing protein [Acetobacteraceae bacterium]|nr:helix-turn-helix domain-containing protein [Acetobacteraceae bacterium]
MLLGSSTPGWFEEDTMMLDETKGSRAEPPPLPAVSAVPEKDGRPSPIDVHVGSRIRLRRTLLGMSQERLGEALGLTFQQVQKYERGVNRVGASRLFDLARVLDVAISFFFDDMPDSIAGPLGASARRLHGLAEAQDPFGDDTMNRRETLELVRAYYRIADPAVRKRVFDLIKTMGPAES